MFASLRSHNNMAHIPFKHDSTYYLAGMSGSGKTRFLHKMLSQPTFFEEPIDGILWCYTTYQTLYTLIERDLPNVTFHEGLPTEDLLDSFTSKYKHAGVVLDDLQLQICKSRLVEKVFLIYAHKKKYSMFCTFQNVLPAGPCMRNIALNSSYNIMIIFKSLRIRGQLVRLNQQIFPLNNITPGL